MDQTWSDIFWPKRQESENELDQPPQEAAEGAVLDLLGVLHGVAADPSNQWTLSEGIASGKLTKIYGKSPFLMGKSTRMAN